MKPRICICCGEPMSPEGNALSRNPNVCASCSSLADGMDEISLPPAPPRAVPRAQPEIQPETVANRPLVMTIGQH